MYQEQTYTHTHISSTPIKPGTHTHTDAYPLHPSDQPHTHTHTHLHTFCFLKECTHLCYAIAHLSFSERVRALMIHACTLFVCVCVCVGWCAGGELPLGVWLGR